MRVKRHKPTIEDDITDLLIKCKELTSDVEKLWKDYSEYLFGKSESTHLVCDSCDGEEDC